MKDFKALVRDTVPIKNPVGTWQWGKNMLRNKKLQSISNEDGFEYQYLINGTIIGEISTTKEVIYFVKHYDGVDEIGVVNTNNENPIYTVKLKTNLLAFKYNCPIEGVFIYNYKNEVIVAWCDGTKENSTSPKILNITNPALNLNPNGTLITDFEFNKLLLFPLIDEAKIELEYLNTGGLDGYSMHITYAYVFNDNSSTPYFSSHILAYLGIGAEQVNKKGVRLNFTELDINFTKLKIGVVIKKDGVFFGYESYIINYTGNTKSIEITNLDGYSSSSVENIILDKSIFSKINSMTKQENQIHLGGVETPTEINFQKYANLLKLKPYRYISTDPQEPSYMPDEVYAFYIEVQNLDGSYSSAFHIPGRQAENTELDIITAQQIIDYKLSWINSNYKQFHLFNNGLVSNDVLTNKFGYWENEETYPNINEYDSSVDYDGNNLNGEDLRNTPIRYHRMPSIKSSYDNGETELPKGGNDFENNLTDTTFYKIGIQIENFNDVIPQEVKDKIQGYRISYIKRTGSNNYVVGNWVLTRQKAVVKTNNSINYYWEGYNFDGTTSPGTGIASPFYNTKVLGVELFKYRPTLNISYIKANYMLDLKSTTTNAITDEYTFGKVSKQLIYKIGNNIAARTQYQEENINMQINDLTYLGNVDNAFVPNITAFSHKQDLYSGFKSTSLIVAQKVNSFANEERIRGGDIFNEVELKLLLSTPYYDGVDVVKQYQTAVRLKGLHSPVNCSQLTNNTYLDYFTSGNSIIIYDPVTADNVDSVILTARDYSFEIKGEADLSTIKNINSILTFDYEDIFINKFPYRIYRGIKIPNESLSAAALRTYLTDDYYEMPNDKGEIIAIRGNNTVLYIQHRFTLFIATIKDKLVTKNVEAYLGKTDLFSNAPTELISDDKGYVGSTSKFACKVIKGLYITVNQVNGQIFIVGQGVKEISKSGNKNWFWENWDNGLDFYETIENEKRRIDNPFISVGHLVGYDKEYNRLLFIKKNYKYIGNNPSVIFDGEFYTLNGNKLEFTDEENFSNLSKTISFDLDTETWQFEHDYYPNLIFHTTNGLYSIINKLEGTDRAKIYKHNDKTTKGLYYGNKFESYVDLIFNQQDITKLYQSITWITDVINNNGGIERLKTITHIMVYNGTQCSGIINIKDNHFIVSRNSEEEWHLNDFRDLIINPSSPILDENGDLIESNINNIKLWFEKSNFISKFITVRLIIDNLDNNAVYINEVKVKSIISKR